MMLYCDLKRKNVRHKRNKYQTDKIFDRSVLIQWMPDYYKEPYIS